MNEFPFNDPALNGVPYSSADVDEIERARAKPYPRLRVTVAELESNCDAVTFLRNKLRAAETENAALLNGFPEYGKTGNELREERARTQTAQAELAAVNAMLGPAQRERDDLRNQLRIAQEQNTALTTSNPTFNQLLAERDALRERERVLQSNIEDVRADRDFARTDRDALRARNEALEKALGDLIGDSFDHYASRESRDAARAVLDAHAAPVEANEMMRRYEFPGGGIAVQVGFTLSEVETAVRESMRNWTLQHRDELAGAVLAKLREVPT